jgi:hypothetical protein
MYKTNREPGHFEVQIFKVVHVSCVKMVGSDLGLATKCASDTIWPDPVPQHCLDEIYFRYRRQCCSLNFIINYHMKLKMKLNFFTILLYYFPILLFVRHRPGPEWGAWGNPQELNWFLPLIKPLRRTRTLCDPVQTQVWSESSVVEHNLYFARLAIMG